MRKKQMLLLLLVLCGIVAAFLGLKRYNQKQEEAEKEKEEQETVHITDFDASEVTAISYYDDDGETLLAFTKTDDTWSYTGDESIDIDEDSMDDMLETLSDITADYTIEDGAASDYGLDAPTQTAVLTFADGTRLTLTFGMENDILGGYYMQVSDDSNIYLAKSTIVTSTLSKSVEDLTAEEETDDSK